MALGVTTDVDILATLKVFYDGQKVENLLFRNDPVLRQIKKVRIGGKKYPLPMLYSRGGATTSDYTKVSALASQTYGAREMEVEPGKLFSSFILEPMEYLASQTEQGAYMSILALKAFSALEGWRKVMARALYGLGYLEQGQVGAVDPSFLYVDVDASTVAALDIGSKVIFSATLTGAPRSGTASTVSKIQTLDDGDVRVTFESAIPGTVVQNDWVLIDGGRDNSYGPNAPIGLGGWIPSLYGRVGANWTTYIGTNFFGVNRSVYVERLAGNFVQRDVGGNERYVDALIRLIKLVRRQGGVPNAIVLNDDDYGTILNEVQQETTLFQAINTAPDKSSANEYVAGLSAMSFQFSTSWLKQTYDTPYCPKGVGYVLDMETVMLLCLSNGKAMEENAGPSGNNPGAPEASSQGEPSTNYQFLIDDYYTTKPADTASGSGLQVDYNFYGSFAVTAPGHNGVIVFTTLAT